VQQKLAIAFLIVGLVGAYFGYSLGLSEATQKCIEQQNQPALCDTDTDCVEKFGGDIEA
jgi:hypothetical protein